MHNGLISENCLHMHLYKDIKICIYIFFIGLHDPCDKAMYVFTQAFIVYHKCLPTFGFCMQPFLSY